MNHNLRNIISGVFLSLVCSCLWAADSATEIQNLKDEKTLFDAQAARDAAAALAIKAANDLAKAKAEASDLAGVIQKSQYDNAAALIKSQVGAQNAQIDALKTTFGAPPTIGTDGNVSISDTSTGNLLEVKAGSLQVTWLLAQQLCISLANKTIKNAIFVPSELDVKIQNSRMVLREFYALVEKVEAQENRKLVGLGGDRAEVSSAAILGAVSLLQYGAGALQNIAKLFKSDYTVGLSTDTTRGTWLEYFTAARCPEQIYKAGLEALVRGQSIDGMLDKLNGLLEFYNAATNKKSAIQKQIEILNARITELKAEKKDASAFQAQLEAQRSLIAEIVPFDVWLPRIQTLISTVSSAPTAFLDALTWYAFGDEKNPLKISSKPRLTAVLTTQDGQVTKSFWLTGKTVYGRSAGELVYRVQDTAGSVVTAGYLTATSSMGEVNFADKTTSVTNNQFMPAAPMPPKNE